jgi:hypothetical protein
MASRKAFLVRNLKDVEAHFPADEEALTWVAASGKWMPRAGGGGASDFTDLGDTPASYATFSGYYVRVNDDESELIFDTVEAGGGGGHTIQDEGIDQTQRTNLNFEGALVTVLDDSDNDATVITIDVASGILSQEVYETLTAQVVSGISHFSLSNKIIEDSLRVYYNGVRQQSDYFAVDSDNLGFTTAFVVEVDDEIFVDYDILTAGVMYAFKDDLETLGIDQDRGTGGSFAYQAQPFEVSRPIQLVSVLWDIRIADNYTLTVRDIDETILATVAVDSVGNDSEDEEFTLDTPLVLDPGFYRLRMTPDSAQTWWDKNGVADYYFNPYVIRGDIDYGGTEYDTYTAPFKLKFYDSYTLRGSGIVHADLAELDADDHEQYLLADGSRIVSGHLTVGDGTASPKVYIDGVAGQHRSVIFQTAGVNRWWVRAANVAETGSNAGSDFEISGRKDDGTWLNTPIRIVRSTGDVQFSKDVRIAGGLYIGATDVDPAPGTLETTGHMLAGVGAGYVLFGVRGGAASNSDIAWYAGTDIAAIFRRDTNDDIVWQRYNPPGTLQDTALTFDSSTGDIYSVPLTAYHGSSDIIGWASTTELRIFYKKVGKTVHVTFRIQGESNSDSCSFTLPYQRTGSAYHFENLCHVRNSGVHGVGYCLVTSTKLVFSRSVSSSATNWSTTGTKSIWGQVWYEAA